MCSCLQILEAFLGFVLITLLNVTLIMLTLRVSRLVELLARFFFFSSRRRHTRCLSDWSSDVCSSDLADAHGGRDLGLGQVGVVAKHQRLALARRQGPERRHDRGTLQQGDRPVLGAGRSEERRVGKEWRSGWRRDHEEKGAPFAAGGGR